MLLLDEPTRGIDLAAKAEIYALLRQLAAEGFGIVLCSSEMSEILTQCHRVVVFREGRVAAELSHEDATEERILAAAAGTGAHAPTGDEPGGKPGGRPPGAPPRRHRLARLTSALGLAAVVLLSIVFSPMRGGRPVFLDIGNLTDILRQVAEKGILAVGMTAVIISGGIDLSVGSVLALAATLTAWLFMKGGVGLGLAALAVLGVGAAVGRGQRLRRRALAPPAVHRDARDDERGARRRPVPERRHGHSARLRAGRRARVDARASPASWCRTSRCPP